MTTMKTLGAAMLAIACSGAASAQTFNFEGAATGTYTSLAQTVGGVTLTISRQDGANFRLFDLSPFDGPPSFGARSLDPFINTNGGAFLADFSAADLTSISIDLGDYNADADTLTLSIFSGLGGTGTLLGTQTIAYPAASSFPDDVATLSLSSFTPFRSAVFNGGSAAFPNSVYYDNIVVTGAAVPEPATWAMMIGGVGMAGGALRRRRAKVKTTVSFA